MIKINRNSVALPTSLDLTREASAANNELNRNDDVIRSGIGELSYTAYSQGSVKEAILNLTNGRCAYCGVKERRTSVEIEHYRPKGLVSIPTNMKITPGYYWLAPIWDNLLPSCNYCNVSRLCEIIEIGQNTPITYIKNEKLAGKSNFFPLLIENRVAPLVKGCESQEYPLLYDPCVDQPDELFSFIIVDIDNEQYLITIPNNELTCANLRLKSQTSIALLGLNNPLIAKDRFDIVSRCHNAVKELQEALDSFEHDNSFKRKIVGVLEFVSAIRIGSYIGLCQRVAKNVIHRTVAVLILGRMILHNAEDNSVEEEIRVLERYCKDYVPNTDIGIL